MHHSIFTAEEKDCFSLVHVVTWLICTFASLQTYEDYTASWPHTEATGLQRGHRLQHLSILHAIDFQAVFLQQLYMVYWHGMGHVMFYPRPLASSYLMSLQRALRYQWRSFNQFADKLLQVIIIFTPVIKTACLRSKTRFLEYLCSLLQQLHQEN